MIYLGESDPQRQEACCQLLNGWSVRFFDDALGLYRELQREMPRLLILNLALPGMDPFLMIRLLKFDSSFAQMPILCLTPYAEPGLPDRLHRLGARGWLRPEGDLHLLGTAVEALLGEGQEGVNVLNLAARAANRKTPSLRLASQL